MSSSPSFVRRRGVGHTSLAAVADAAGVTRGAICRHSRSKAELFKATVERAELPIDAALEDLGDGRSDVRSARRAR
jgi:AcrR family transcriptional regulator